MEVIRSSEKSVDFQRIYGVISQKPDLFLEVMNKFYADRSCIKPVLCRNEVKTEQKRSRNICNKKGSFRRSARNFLFHHFALWNAFRLFSHMTKGTGDGTAKSYSDNSNHEHFNWSPVSDSLSLFPLLFFFCSKEPFLLIYITFIPVFLFCATTTRISLGDDGKGKRVKLSLCLINWTIKHHAMKTYGRVETQLHYSWPRN
jgi:hypothetical protein